MQNNLPTLALARATLALSRVPTRDIQRMPFVVCAFMLNALPRTPNLVAMRQQLAARLQQQLDVAQIRQGDMYEVFSALTALWQYDPALVSGECLTTAVQRLIASEVKLGGPYNSGSSLELAANAQITLFVRLIAAPLPNEEVFLASAIAARRFGARALTKTGILYLLTKAHRNEDLARYITQQSLSPLWQTPQHIAIALLCLPPSVQSTGSNFLESLFYKQHHNGFWLGEPLLKHVSDPIYSSLVTTALIVEALTYNQQHLPKKSSNLQRQHHAVARAARHTFTIYTEPLRSSALATINQICLADKNFEITLLPHFFAQALITPHTLTKQQYTALGQASLYGWIAYTIYDDFLDDEGEPTKLPVANIAMRASLDCFRVALPSQAGFQQYVANTFAAMDEANAWEISRCRFTVQDGKITIYRLPRYGNGGVLAARSFAHALAPMAVLAQMQMLHGRHLRRVESAFKHYLIARQLNDDLHDWLKDIQVGQASFVVTAILRDMRIKPSTYTLHELLPIMQKQFRQKTMPKISRRILQHVNTSRLAFKKSQLLRAPNTIYHLLDDLELSVHYALDQRSKAETLHNVHAHDGKTIKI